MPKLTKTDDALQLSLTGLPKGDFERAKDQVRSIKGRRWNPEKKVWELPLRADVAERVMVTIRPTADAVLLSWVRKEKAASQQEIVTPLDLDAEVQIPWGDKLYDYQRAFVAFAAENPRLLLADDMGLGKTAQALGATAEYRINHPDESDGPKLIICPNSVKGVWAREIMKWLGPDEPYEIVNKSTPAAREKQLQDIIAKNGWAIVNWEQIRSAKETVIERGREKIVDRLKQPLFGSTPWVTVIADEAHRAKSRKSQQTKGLFQIDAPMKLALSGTPLMNSPDELWPLLRWLYGREQYGSYWRFFDDYVDYYETDYGKVITGVANPEALRFELSSRLVRRTKDEVLSLPAKTRVVVPVTLKPKQRALYEKAEKEMWFEVEQAIKEGDETARRFAEAAADGDYSQTYMVPNGAARTVRLRQVAATPALLGGADDSAKLDAAVEIISDAQPKQFVVFSEFVETCSILAERLRAKGLTATTFTGALSPEERTYAEDGFQNGEIDVLIGTIAAMGEGVTLHAADTAIFLEEHWTPAKNDQAADRLHRMGQKNPVTILLIQAEDTVDTGKVGPRNLVKRMIVSTIVKQDDVEEIVRDHQTEEIS